MEPRPMVITLLATQAHGVVDGRGRTETDGD